MSIPKSLRYQVLRRDNYTCRYCGRSAPEWPMRVDHVIPEALGGPALPENLTTACQDCNAGKAALPPDAPLVRGVNDDAERWAAAMVRAAEMQRLDADAVRARDDAFMNYWAGFAARRGTGIVRADEGWRASIEAFYRSGLLEADLLDAVDVTMAKRGNVGDAHLWRYFCGVCWNKVEQRRELAARLLAEDEELNGAVPAYEPTEGHLEAARQLLGEWWGGKWGTIENSVLFGPGSPALPVLEPTAELISLGYPRGAVWQALDDWARYDLTPAQFQSGAWGLANRRDAASDEVAPA